MPMLAAVTCLFRRRRMHCRGSDAPAAPAPELDQGQHGPGDHRHRWRDRDEPALVVGMPGREETTLPRAPLSSRQQGRRRLPRDGLPPVLGSRRRRHLAAGAEQAPTPTPTQEEIRGQPGRVSSAAAVWKKKAPPAAGGAVSSPSSGALSPAAVLCAVCLEEVRQGNAATLPCSHSYHPGCVLPWLAAHGACPCCRAAVPSPAGLRGELPTCEIDLV
ncbi:unnamed protein product [Urochloa decumbens]|uniref:RING-type domain-containing protein n=1 Tax=Urochloa decumbens TaxID=240449 RepID=A0ABC9AU43_9POAL